VTLEPGAIILHWRTIKRKIRRCAVKKFLILAALVVCVAAGYPALAEEDFANEEAAQALEEPGAMTDEAEATAEPEAATFSVGRLVIAEYIEGMEPVGVTDLLSDDAGKAFCFLEATGITDDTDANFVWYRDDVEVARVPLRLRMGERWRTFSSKNVEGLPGNWKVAIEDASGNVLETVAFSVE
jgi:hypothetical protein